MVVLLRVAFGCLLVLMASRAEAQRVPRISTAPTRIPSAAQSSANRVLGNLERRHGHGVEVTRPTAGGFRARVRTGGFGREIARDTEVTVTEKQGQVTGFELVRRIGREVGYDPVRRQTVVGTNMGYGPREREIRISVSERAPGRLLEYRSVEHGGRTVRRRAYEIDTATGTRTRLPEFDVGGGAPARPRTATPRTPAPMAPGVHIAR
jgi:hypothetical protein